MELHVNSVREERAPLCVMTTRLIVFNDNVYHVDIVLMINPIFSANHSIHVCNWTLHTPHSVCKQTKHDDIHRHGSGWATMMMNVYKRIDQR